MVLELLVPTVAMIVLARAVNVVMKLMMVLSTLL